MLLQGPPLPDDVTLFINKPLNENSLKKFKIPNDNNKIHLKIRFLFFSSTVNYAKTEDDFSSCC